MHILRIVETVSVPIVAIEIAELDGFSKVLGGYLLGVVEVGYGSGEAQYTIMSAARSKADYDSPRLRLRGRAWPWFARARL
jgi:hypothetical protein